MCKLLIAQYYIRSLKACRKKTVTLALIKCSFKDAQLYWLADNVKLQTVVGRLYCLRRVTDYETALAMTRIGLCLSERRGECSYYSKAIASFSIISSTAIYTDAILDVTLLMQCRPNDWSYSCNDHTTSLHNQLAPFHYFFLLSHADKLPPAACFNQLLGDNGNVQRLALMTSLID